MLRCEAVVFGVVEGFHNEVCSVQWFRACRRGEKIDIVLCLRLSGKAAEPVLRHMRGWMPKRQSDGAALKHPQGSMPDLKTPRSISRMIECHAASRCG